MHLAEFLKVLDDRHRRLFKGFEALLDALDIVVGATARLAALEESSEHDVFGAVKEQNELALGDFLFKVECLIHLAREPVDAGLLRDTETF